MSRLTEHMPDYLGYVEFQFKRGVNEQDAVSRLGEIEDILCASDGSERITLDRLRELVMAERDGRVVVLPCQVGDTVYDILEYLENRDCPEIYEHKAREIEIGQDKRGVYYTIDSTIFRPQDFGKSAFTVLADAEAAITRAEAEAKGEQE